MQLINSHFACIDLFSGCGGNSWGMLLKSDFRQLTPLLAIDWDPVAIATLQFKH